MNRAPNPARSAATAPGTSGLDTARIRRDFPILDRAVHGKPLVYLDNAATTQKPRAVLAAMAAHYDGQCSNVHRGVHDLSVKATEAFEGARATVRDFVHANSTREIVFCRGTTEAMNLLASSFGGEFVGAGDEIVLSGMEHHSNIVPWQLLAARVGAKIVVVPVTDTGEIRLEDYEACLTDRTRIVSVVHTSNVLGTRNPVEKMIRIAHDRGVPVALDAAQAMAHEPVDVQALDCDFLAFSAHKMYGPTGIGVLYGKEDWLARMPPYQGGGDMIRTVSFEETTYSDLPYKFEAGTPSIADAIGLGAAIDYLNGVGFDAISAHESALLRKTTERLLGFPRLRLIGTAPNKAAVVSFVLDGVHPHDIGTVLDHEGIAIRAGHHCCQPLMKRFGVPATARASFAVYNTPEEIDALARGIERVFEVFG